MKSVVLTDGGMGQELLRRSGTAPTPLWSARVLIDEPALVQTLHEDFIRAGARVITINTYAATPERLARDGLGDLFKPLQKSGIELAQRARDAVGEPVRIAGCLPPLFGSYKPNLTLTFEETLDMYRRVVAEQAQHVDLILCETMASGHEALAAATAAAESGKPIWVSWTLNDNGDGSPRLRSGETISDAAAMIAHIKTEARMVNCSKPEAVSAAFDELKSIGGTVGAYANGFTSISALKHGGTVDVLAAREDLGPDAYASFAVDWARRGASIVGGCCEVGPEHIAVLRQQLEQDGFTISGVV